MIKPRFSIRYKILSMITLLLIGALGMYLVLATRVFKQDKTELVFDLNKSVVTTLAAEVETALRGVDDKLRMYALLVGDGANKPHTPSAQAFKQVMAGDPFLVRVELYEMASSEKMKLVSQMTDAEFEKIYGTSRDFYTGILVRQRPIPFAQVKSNAVTVWNATVKNGPALMGMGIPVIKEGALGQPEKVLAVVGYIKTDLFLRNLKTSRLTQAFIVDEKGEVLVHNHSDYMIQATNFSSLPIVSEMRRGQVPVGVMEYDDHGEKQLGAYARLNTAGLGVVSQVEGQKAFLAVSSLIRRSILFALIISTVTFIATIVFSRSLTQPLQRLVGAMEKVSDGSLDTELQVGESVGDEIGVLAHSFNQMTSDLKTSRFQLEEINRELENKVIDRTKKLEEQNHAVKEAQEALLRTTRLASVGEIAGRTAHEVLNPLTSLMARVQKVQKRLSDEVSVNKNLLGEIVAAWRQDLAARGPEAFIEALAAPSTIDPKTTLLQEDLHNMGQIVSNWNQDLMTLSDDTEFLLQQAGRIDKILRQMRSLSVVNSQKADTPVHTVLNDAINIHADLFTKNKIEIVKRFMATDCEVKLDRDEFIQVLTNLFRNALQAIHERQTPQFLGVVCVETSNVDGHLMIDIIDNGVGINAENRAKLFESQFSTKAPDLGTGLGLSISRRFVRAFNGDVFLVKSSVGEGTTFRIKLPVAASVNRVAA